MDDVFMWWIFDLRLANTQFTRNVCGEVRNLSTYILQVTKAFACGVSKASRFTRGKPSVPHCVRTGSAKSRRFVYREGKARRFTYEKQSGRARVHRPGTLDIETL